MVTINNLSFAAIKYIGDVRAQSVIDRLYHP